ncbi:MAG: hypothetical protein H0Z39_01195 [Peptococcaceae bacterium]|nr:hypothetical protein [Peptococcaceae bacterium]
MRESSAVPSVRHRTSTTASARRKLSVMPPVREESNTVRDDVNNLFLYYPPYLWWTLSVFLIVMSCGGLCLWWHHKPCFTSIVERNLVTGDQERYSKTTDISRIRTFSFLVLNDGPNPVVVQPELSPDGITWGSFGESEHVIEPGGRHLFVLQFFLRYARIKFRNKVPGRDSVVTVWFQGQG